MSLNETTEHLHLLSNEFKTRLKSIKDIDARRTEYCRISGEWGVKYGIRGIEILYELMNSESLFPSVEDRLFFLKFAVTKKWWDMVNYLEQSGLKIHEVMFEDGKSALHYLAGIYESLESSDYKSSTINIITYSFVNNPQRNYCDNHGYTYLHGACMAGKERAVNSLLSQEGVDVHIDTYTRSLLYIACQHRRENCVKILLEHGADPNKGDREQQSTPLHALALPCLCDCVCFSDYTCYSCDYRRPVDEIVKMLVDKGAQIEAHNCHGDTPLQSAVSRFDVELTRALLKYGASLSNLNEDKMFSASFTSIEMKCYPLTFNMIQVMQLLQSAGYKMGFLTRLRMMKYWIRVRGNEIDYIIGDGMRNGFLVYFYYGIKNSSLEVSHEDAGLEPGATGGNIELTITKSPRGGKSSSSSSSTGAVKKQHHHHHHHHDSSATTTTKAEIVTHEPRMGSIGQAIFGTSLSGVGSSTSTTTTTTQQQQQQQTQSSTGGSSNPFVVRDIRRAAADQPTAAEPALAHVQDAGAADLFMTDYCSLNLPQNVCLEVAKNMSDEDLFRLFEQTNIDDIIDQQSKYVDYRIRYVRLTL
ncbi:unnamed protein product [Trichogramma brassicae]|uniref:Uncharacterized protein n=1 Tax=Trichogramma brassicae TaxID=86971 RepID=A0A6H5IYC0_9HYME|nr:unnamed protein product [Trichogramma brassicae]